MFIPNKQDNKDTYQQENKMVIERRKKYIYHQNFNMFYSERRYLVEEHEKRMDPIKIQIVEMREERIKKQKRMGQRRKEMGHLTSPCIQINTSVQGNQQEKERPKDFGWGNLGHCSSSMP